MRLALVAVVFAAMYLPVTASAQVVGAWTTETQHDEFDGTYVTVISQLGTDRELLLSIGCQSEVDNIWMMLVAPGPSASWNVFQNGTVDIRIDDREAETLTFTDNNRTLSRFTIPFENNVVSRLSTGSRLLMRVRAFRSGSETDTFNLRGLESAIAEADCGD